MKFRYLVLLSLVVLVGCVENPTGFLSLEATFNQSACFTASAFAAPGDTITLNATVQHAGAANCIILDVFNVTLDCKNFAVNGSGSLSDAAAISIRAHNSTIQNCIVQNFLGTSAFDLYSDGFDNISVLNNTFEFAGDYLIRINNSDNVIFENNVVNRDGGGFKGLYGTHVSDFVFRNNSVNNSISFFEASRIQITRNKFYDIDTLSSPADSVVFGATNDSIIAHHRNIESGFSASISRNISAFNNSLIHNGRIRLQGTDNYIYNNSLFNATLDGTTPGFFLTGPGFISNNTLRLGMMFSVYASGSNITVENNIVEDIQGKAYDIVNGINVLVRNNTANNVTGIAFDISNCQQCNFTQNGVSFINKIASTYLGLFYSFPRLPEAGYAFRIANGGPVNVYNNTVSVNNAAGLSVEDSGIVSFNIRNLSIYNNSFSGLRDGVLLTNSSGFVLANNTFTDVSREVIKVEYGPDGRIYGNTVTAPSAVADLYRYRRALNFVNSEDAVSHNNSLSGYFTGVYSYNSTNCSVLNTNISASGHGVFLFGSRSFILNDVNVTASKIGLKLFMSDDTAVNLSEFVSSRLGFQLSQSDFNNITGSDFTSGTNLVDHNSQFNNISSNVFTSSGTFDVEFDLFAHDNNGTGNVIPKGFVETNFAYSNSVI